MVWCAGRDKRLIAKAWSHAGRSIATRCSQRHIGLTCSRMSLVFHICVDPDVSIREAVVAALANCLPWADSVKVGKAAASFV